MEIGIEIGIEKGMEKVAIEMLKENEPIEKIIKLQGYPPGKLKN